MSTMKLEWYLLVLVAVATAIGVWHQRRAKRLWVSAFESAKHARRAQGASHTDLTSLSPVGRVVFDCVARETGIHASMIDVADRIDRDYARHLPVFDLKEIIIGDITWELDLPPTSSVSLMTCETVGELIDELDRLVAGQSHRAG